jgi:hypothetical protein
MYMVLFNVKDPSGTILSLDLSSTFIKNRPYGCQTMMSIQIKFDQYGSTWYKDKASPHMIREIANQKGKKVHLNSAKMSGEWLRKMSLDDHPSI